MQGGAALLYALYRLLLPAADLWGLLLGALLGERLGGVVGMLMAAFVRLWPEGFRSR